MYQYLGDKYIKRLSDGAEIPVGVEDNADWQRVLAWAAEGNTIAPAPLPEPQVPQVVSRRQARQAMVLSGISFANVQAAIDAIADPQQRALMQIEWEDSQEFHRDRPQLISLASALGLTSAQLDDLFTLAATL